MIVTYKGYQACFKSARMLLNGNLSPAHVKHLLSNLFTDFLLLEFNAKNCTEIDAKLTEFRHFKVAIFTCSALPYLLKSSQKNKE